MADGYNRVMLLGSLGADPELRFTQGGQAVLNLRMATNSSYYDKAQDKRVERTDWHSCVIWGKRGEALAKILTKGSSVFVEGSLRTSSYDDKKTGAKRYKTEINVDDLIITGSKGGQQRHAEDPADSYDRTQEPAGSGADDFDPGVPAFEPVAPPARTGGGGYGPPMPRRGPAG